MERSRSTRDSSRDSGRDSGRDGGRDDRGGRSSRDDAPARGRGRGDSGRDSGRAGSSYSYKPRTAEEMNKRSNQGAKDFDVYVRNDVKTFSPHDGANTIRILPPTWDDPNHYGIDIHVHYGVGPDSQSYLCLNKMKGEACPICEELVRARQGRESEEYVKNLEPTKRVLFYMIDRDNEKDGVIAWAAPWTIDRDITKVSVDRKTNEVLPIDDPRDGFDVEFDRTGKGIGTKYVGITVARRESSLGDDAWLDWAIDNPLTEVLEYYSYDHILKAFGGGGSHRGRDDKDDQDNSRNRGRGRDSGGRDNEREERGARGRDEGASRGGREERSSRSREPAHTWESVHALEGTKLDDIVAAEKLDLNPNDFDSDEALADAICEDLKIDKPEEKASRRGRTESAPSGDDDRLAAMRARREGR